MPAAGDNKGFTLLELMLALTITAMIGVILLGAFRIGIRAWEKGERDTEKHQRQRMVLNMMREQIVAISLPKIENNDQSPFLLQGDMQNLELVSRRSLLNADRDEMVKARYTVDSQETEERKQLLYFETNKLWMRDYADGSGNERAEADVHELIQDAYRIQFEYLDTKDVSGIEEVEDAVDNFTWLPEWNSEQNTGFPRAVRITLIPEPDTPPLRVIARITVEQPFWGAD